MRLGRWLLAGLVALGLCASAMGAARVTAEEFASRLRRAGDVAELGKADPSPFRMVEMREALGLPADVDAGEWVLVVPRDPFLESLSGERAEDFEMAGSHLQGLQQALDDALGRHVPGDSQVTDALDRAYGGLVQDQPSIVDGVLRAIGDAIGAVIYRLVHFTGPTTILVWAMLLSLIAGAIILLRGAQLVPESTRPTATGSRALADRVDWAARADEALRAGDVREAVRALYLALLAALARGGLLADAPALTAGEARSAVSRTAPAIYAAVARATDSYERVVYGGTRPTERDLEVLRDAAASATRR